MKRVSVALLGAIALLSWSCNDLGGDGGGGGGPGGGFVFNSGYVSVRRDTGDLFIIDSSAPNNAQQLTNNGSNHTPAISPDGRTVVFTHDTASGTDLEVVPTTGTGSPSVLLAASADRANLRNPVFSPDGSTIAFAFDRNGQTFVAEIGANGAGFLELVQTGSTSYGSPSWYPDGSSLLVVSGNSPNNLTQLVQLNVSTQQLTNIGPLPSAIADRAVLSPDGTTVAFDAVSGNASTPRVFAMALSSGTVTQLSDHPSDPGAQDTAPAWGASGQVIFSSDTGGADNVYSIAANTATPGGGTLVMPTGLEPWFH